MRWLGRSVAGQIVLLALLAVALSAGIFAGALRLGVVPQFQQILAAGSRLALVVENGPVCNDPVPLAACNSGVRQEFRVWLYADNSARSLVRYNWQK
jgi:hypothetical protein